MIKVFLKATVARDTTRRNVILIGQKLWIRGIVEIHLSGGEGFQITFLVFYNTEAGRQVGRQTVHLG